MPNWSPGMDCAHTGWRCGCWAIITTPRTSPRRRWRQLPDFKAESSFATWLYQIFTRRALNRITQTRATSSLDMAGDIGVPGADPAVNAERNQAIDAVAAAVAALPPPQRVAIVLHHLEGLPKDEIARITSSPVPAVRSYLFRGRRTLAMTLAEWR